MAYEMFSYKIKMSLLDSNCFRLYFIEPEIILKFSIFKVAEIQRKHAQPIGSSDADAMTRDQARKLQLQVLDSKRNIGDLKAKVNIIYIF